MAAARRILRRGEESGVTQVHWMQTGGPSVGIAPFAPPPPSEGFSAHDSEQGKRSERESYDRGLAEGLAAGKEQAAAELQPVFEKLGRSLVELSSLRPRIRKNAEQDLIKLSLAIARRVLHRELTLDPESISGLIKVALEKLQSREVSRVRIHPEYETVIRALLDRYGASQMEVARDASLQRGDVLFETAQGTLDASIESQLREIERGFADRLSR
jgi:flagellar assembly protein FliH